ncbi:TIGR01841 family phasin [Sphingomonas sp. HF-S3]|uniref:TIGR01841 family phasin n=1 Tax=Sphingomonas rustica TaxID=3103142 RepID=A0ABV0B2F1_9SPHN
MASKGPKNFAGKPPAIVKAAARPKVAAKAKVAEVASGETAPIPPVATAPVTIEPAAVAQAASQEVKVAAEAPAAVVETAAEAIEAVVEQVQPEAPAVEPVIEAVESVIPAAVKESSIMETFENATAKTQNFFSDVNERGKVAVEKSTKMIEEANEFAKGNVEAIVESGKIAAKGFETLGQDAADYGRRSFESATAALKSMASAKSPTEFFKLQSDFIRTSFDSYVAEASKNTEAMLKLAGEAAQPLSNRVAVAAEKAKIAA